MKIRIVVLVMLLSVIACGGGFVEDFAADGDPIDFVDEPIEQADFDITTWDELDDGLLEYLGYDNYDDLYAYLDSLSDDEFDDLILEYTGLFDYDELYAFYDYLDANSGDVVVEDPPGGIGEGQPEPTEAAPVAPPPGSTAPSGDIRFVELGTGPNDGSFQVTLNPGDVSFLLTLQSADPTDIVVVFEIVDPNGQVIFEDTGDSVVSAFYEADEFIFGTGEVSMLLPRVPQADIQPGTYTISYYLEGNSTISRAGVWIKSGPVDGVQMAFDMNLWVLSDNDYLYTPEGSGQMVAALRRDVDSILNQQNLQLGALNLIEATPSDISNYSSTRTDDAALSTVCKAMAAKAGETSRALNMILLESLPDPDDGDFFTAGISTALPGAAMFQNALY